MAIIKKGSYRWNDNLTALPSALYGKEVYECANFYFDEEFYLSDSNIVALQNVKEEFEASFAIPRESGNYKARVNCSAFWTLSSNYLSYIVGDVECGEYNELFTFLYYASSRDGRFDVYSETWKNIQYQTITVTEDTEVSPEFYEWFVENTKTVIKAGTYRFNDVLERIRVAQSLNFYMPFSYALNDNGSIIKEDTPFYCVAFDWKTLDVLRYVAVEGESILAYGETDSGFTWDVMWLMASDSLGTDGPDFLKGYGQTIIIPEDAEVDEAFAAWFAENTKRKQFTKLNIGDVAYSSGGKCFKRLTMDQPQEPPTTLVAGLYDADDNLVASWDTLVNAYGMDCERDYTSSSYKTDTASPYYVLTNNSELASGVKLIIADSVTRIGSYAFRDCTSLTSVVIPDSVTIISERAFVGCASLTSIEIPDSVTSIGELAFTYCASLTSVEIPDSVTSIGYQAFFSCTSLTSIEIPNSVIFMGDSVFYGCTSLTSVIIGDGVTSIGKWAFLACVNLTSIKYRGTEERWNAISKGTDWDLNTGDYTITYNYTGE